MAFITAREAAPSSTGDASILLATVYGGNTASAKNLAPSGGLASLTTNTINQIGVNTETNAIAGFFGTALAELGMTPVEDERATPAALERLLKLEIERWGRIIRDAGITPQ